MSSKCDNWRMVFGSNVWTWLLPVKPADIAIDAHNFPKRQETIMQNYEMIIHPYPEKDSVL